MISEEEKLSIIQWIIEIEDEEIISKINAIKNEATSLSQSQKEVLAARMKRYAEGSVEFSSWKDVKARIIGDA